MWTQVTLFRFQAFVTAFCMSATDNEQGRAISRGEFVSDPRADSANWIAKAAKTSERKNVNIDVTIAIILLAALANRRHHLSDSERYAKSIAGIGGIGGIGGIVGSGGIINKAPSGQSPSGQSRRKCPER